MASKKVRDKRLKIVAWVSVGCAILLFCYFAIIKPNRKTKFIVYKEFGIPIPADYTIHGIDVSRYQETILWDAVENMNVRGVKLGFVFIKATEGSSSKDPFFKRNWKKARDAGIIRGAYHFFSPSKDARLQAEHFIKNVNIESGDLPPVLDIEQLGNTTSEKLKKEVKKFLLILERHYGVKPIIYTNANFYKEHFLRHFDEYPLWVAHYLEPHKPRISREWSFWQHNESGRVNGIHAKVDFNVFNGDSAAFTSLLVP